MSNGRATDKEPLLTPPDDELQFFRTCLRWMCMDHSNRCHALLSWFLFVLLALAVPYVLSDPHNPRGPPLALLVQLSLSAAAAISFLFLSVITYRFGLRGFLFLDELRDVSDRVRIRYTAAINSSFRFLAQLVAPCFAAEVAYKICWYCFGAGRIPFSGDRVLSDAVACLLEPASWIYRTAIYLLACLVFRLICHLQTLRLQDLAAVFPEESEEEREVLQEHRGGGTLHNVIMHRFPEELKLRAVLQEHRRVRKLVEVIGLRSCYFIAALIDLACISLGAAVVLASHANLEINLLNNGELVLCSLVLITGLSICLKSAEAVILAAQELTSCAARWHARATLEACSADSKTPYEVTTNPDHVFPVHDEEGEPQIVRPDANIISFQKRQALVMYFKHHADDIKVPLWEDMYLSQTFIRSFNAFAFALLLGLLGKTIGISPLDLLKL